MHMSVFISWIYLYIVLNDDDDEINYYSIILF